ncbi:MAG: hypothetical protein JJE25_13330 [Bacteroidia bacterium]|nr:hypothetical protein [Bacteroidia bacterium]
MKQFALSVLLVLLLADVGHAQQRNSWRLKSFTTLRDTLFLDSLTIVPGSISVFSENGNKMDSSSFHADYINGILFWKNNALERKQHYGENIRVEYRVFYFRLNNIFTHKDTSLVNPAVLHVYNPFTSRDDDKNKDPFHFEGLNKSGSISRGISFGNNQDVVVNSSLNLQLSGRVSDNINILAAITDENVPFQPEGNTQQLSDFDKVYIQLFNDNSKLTAGDYDLKRPNSYFMNFFKKSQGASFVTKFNLTDRESGKNDTMRTAASFSISKGKVARNIIPGIEGNQGPYRLTGNNNEIFIIALSGTERVYLDGTLLTRGQQYDYVIDYNTAQVTFTPRHLISKDSRIVVEFEYSDKYYLRTLFFFNNEYEKDKVRLKFNFYTEQDSKNQPLQQSLDSTRKQTLADVGDNLQNAFYSTADSVAFNVDQIMYAKMDTVDCNGNPYRYYFYSIADSAHWLLTFSFTGAGGGDYVTDNTAANGKVYRWVAPVNCVSQGSYEPKALLISPKKQQMMTLGADVKFSETSTLTTEAAYSVYNVNLFSEKDKGNDDGYALRAIQNKIFKLDKKEDGWNLTSTLGYEYVSKNFKSIERYRAIEFERDWNLVKAQQETENIGSIQLQLDRKSTGNISYQSKYFQRGNPFAAFNQVLSSSLNVKKFKLINSASYLTTKNGAARTEYIRHRTDFSRQLGKIILGTIEEGERNRFYVSSDSLRVGSFQYQQLQFYVTLSDTSGKSIRADVSKRNDFSVRNGELKQSTEAENAGITFELTKNPNHVFSFGATYRELRIIDTTLTAQQPLKSFLGRTEYRMTLLKGGITSSTYLEIGTGQEQKKQYIYLEVPAGQGVYVWNDYNGNGIKELNEFEVSAFASSANYVRVFVPTNEYVTSRSSQANEVLSINPSQFIRPEGNKTNFFTRLSNQSQGRIERKTVNETFAQSLNPFRTSIEDTSLISLTSLLRNTFYFNRNSSVYGFDATWQQNSTKSLYSNGFEYRVLITRSTNLRWNISRTFLFTGLIEKNNKTNSSEFFSSRDYDLSSLAYEPRISLQPGNTFRITFSVRSGEIKNLIGANTERAEKLKYGMDIKYNSLSAGILSANFDYIAIKFNSQDNTPLAYEMLDGLRTGKNMTWGLSLQRSITSFMQLTLNYEGRKSESINAIHTGGMQLRAYF